jgi:hypothetical protein
MIRQKHGRLKSASARHPAFIEGTREAFTPKNV